jgi:transcriptional regulator NrdR family protein
MSFRVVKRDKQLEDFNEAKIVNVLEASGLSQEEAQHMCIVISKWIEDTKKPLVTTLQIRDRIITELQKTNRDAANHYIEYEKTRDKTIGGPNS